MGLGEKVRRAMKPDAQAFDEIRITTEPRYKMSDLSGAEWRISARIAFMRNGQEIDVSYARNVETATAFLPGKYLKLLDDGKGYFAGEGDFCDQEGCLELFTVTLQLKQHFCRDGHPSDTDVPTVRKFCGKHASRGDCSLEDAERNYVRV